MIIQPNTSKIYLRCHFLRL